MEALMTFEFEKFKVETFWNGGRFVPNKTYIDGILVYEDNTFRPSPLHNIDEVQTMVSLLGFLTIREGGVEKEFFIERNAPILDAWANDYKSEAEEIGIMLYDYEQKDEENYLKENEITFEFCSRIENYIKIN